MQSTAEILFLVVNLVFWPPLCSCHYLILLLCRAWSQNLVCCSRSASGFEGRRGHWISKCWVSSLFCFLFQFSVLIEVDVKQNVSCWMENWRLWRTVSLRTRKRSQPHGCRRCYLLATVYCSAGGYTRNWYRSLLPYFPYVISCRHQGWNIFFPTPYLKANFYFNSL